MKDKNVYQEFHHNIVYIASEGRHIILFVFCLLVCV